MSGLECSKARPVFTYEISDLFTIHTTNTIDIDHILEFLNFLCNASSRNLPTGYALDKDVKGVRNKHMHGKPGI